MQAAEAQIAESAAPRPWSVGKRIAFRLVFCYFLLYASPETERVTLTDAIPGGAWITGWYVKLWHAIVPWVATRVFHVTGRAATYFETGSGDTTLSYVHVFCFLVLAATGTLAWSILDRQRPN